jgi:hypothetical protein
MGQLDSNVQSPTAPFIVMHTSGEREDALGLGVVL